MAIEIGICKCHGQKRVIVNKRYHLCQIGNQDRLGSNTIEKQIEKRTKYRNKQVEKAKEKIKSKIFVDPQFIQNTKPRTSVNKLSLKEAANKKKLHTVYKEMDETREAVCSGCGREDVLLSHSHIISRHQNKSLESDPENIVFDCLTMGERKGCHDIWEHGTQKEKVEKLLNYQERMQYIYEKEPKLWHRLKAKESN